MRIVNFVDGASSETTPTIGNIVASALVTYPNDAAYEAAEVGAPADGNIYFNTTDDVIRYYNGTIWQELIDEGTTQAVANKVIDADINTLTNIDNNEIKPSAGIEATKIADGSVDDTEFETLDGVTSSIQTQLDSKIAWSTPVDADIIPDGTGRDFGSVGQPFDQGFTDSLFFENGDLATGGNAAGANGTRIRGTNPSLPVTIETISNNDDNANPTRDTYILTGNKTAGTGDSGNIIAQTGTSAGGTRGSLKYKDGSEGTIGHIITSKGVDGESEWAAPSLSAGTTENSNLDVISGGDWSFDGTNLVLSEDAFVQHPPFLDDRNRIAAQSIPIADGEVAYVDINKVTDSPTTLTVTTVAVGSFVQTDNRFVIARRNDNISNVITEDQLLVDSAGAILTTTSNGAHRSQGFVAGTTGVLTDISLKQGRLTGLSGDWSLDIRTDDGGGKPTLTILDSATFDSTALPLIATLPLGAFQNYAFTGGVTLTSGVTYHMVWSNVSLAGSGSDRIDVEFWNADVITGDFRTSSDNGTTWGSPVAIDVNFEVFVDATDFENVQVGEKLNLSNGDSSKIYQGISVNKIQTKFLTADVTTNITMTDLTFNALVIGKQYTVTLQSDLSAEVGANDIQIGIDINHNSAVIGRAELVFNTSLTSGGNVTSGNIVTFTAAATTLTFSTFSASANSFVNGNNSAAETWAQIEERNDLVVTTDFT